MKKGFCFMKKMLGFFAVIILVSCGGGSDNGGTTGETQPTGAGTITNAGSITISGNDIGAGEGILTPTLFQALPINKNVSRNWTSSFSAPITLLIVIFNPDETIQSVGIAIDNEKDGFAERQYFCFSITSTSICNGITHDPSAKTITFDKTILDKPQADATAPVTINGTLKYPE